MDFFEHQSYARRQSRRLVVFFFLALIGVSTTLAWIITVIITGLGTTSSAPEDIIAAPFLSPALPVIAGLILVVMLISSLWKLAFLKGNGDSIAQEVGGRRVDPATTDLAERRLLNVVEEMAIASGVPVPSVFVLDKEESLNAFAAGFAPSGAAIGVTRGLLTRLPRDELQGVIAHEFSHILNGDMRLNLRLIGYLHGLIVLSLIGRTILRVMDSPSRSSSRSRRGGGGGQVALVGIALFIIGSLGVFFARLIKSAVSRQREYLADASAVQFTRNPGGISGALKRIGGFSSGSRVDHPRAEEVSHMFFSNGLRASFLSLFATHPPLRKRIQRIEPSFTGEYLDAPEVDLTAEAPPGITGLTAGTVPPRPGVERVVSRVGAPAREHLEWAHRLLRELPAHLHMELTTLDGAEAIVLALLLHRQAQGDLGTLPLSEPERARIIQNLPLIATLRIECILPLLELCLPALRTMSKEQYTAFADRIIAIIDLDRARSIFDSCVVILLRVLLAERVLGTKPPETKYHRAAAVAPATRVVLSALARASRRDDEAAYRAGSAAVGLELPLAPVAECALGPLYQALERLRSASPMLKRSIVAACGEAALADREVSPDEYELLRVVCAVLECPLPPLITGGASHSSAVP